MDSQGRRGSAASPDGGGETRSFPVVGSNPWGPKPAQSTKLNSAPPQSSGAQAKSALSSKPPAVFQPDDISSSDDEDAQEERPDISRLEASIFGDYELEGADEGDAGIEKIRDHLISTQSGVARCLICLEKVGAKGFGNWSKISRFKGFQQVGVQRLECGPRLSHC